MIDSDGNSLPCGEEGELVVGGPTIFQGYYKSAAENREAFTPDGFYRTGDIAKFDPVSRLILTG